MHSLYKNNGGARHARTPVNMLAVQEHQSLLPQLLPQDEPDELELESEYDGEDAQLESLLEEADELDEPHDEPPPEDSTSIAGTSNEDASILNPPSVLAAKLRSRSTDTSGSPMEKSPVKPKPPLAFW